jgi:hypothetical protein
MIAIGGAGVLHVDEGSMQRVPDHRFPSLPNIFFF